MINKNFYFPLLLSTFFFSATAAALNPHLMLYNDNQQAFGNWDSIQMKVVSPDGYWTISPPISAELGRNFVSQEFPSAHTSNPVDIYIHDVALNTPYQLCAHLSIYDGVKIYGSTSNDGKYNFKCIVMG